MSFTAVYDQKSRAATGASPRVLYVLHRRDAPSETFIRREIADLVAQGTRLVIVSLCAPQCSPDSELAEISPPRALSPRLWLSVLRAALQSRRRMPELMRETWSLRTTERYGWAGCLRWMGLALAIRTALNDSLPDVVHAHFGSAPATVARLLATLIERPWGVSVHARDIYAADARALGVKLATARHVIACSEAARDDVRQRLPPRLRGRVHAIHHGLRLDEWPPRATAVLRRRPQVVAVGRLVVKKGFDRLVEACALLRDDLFAVDCDIIGEGPERPALERLVARRCLDTRVRLPGWSSGEKLQARYATAAICVIPSVVAPDGDRDNIPNVLAEAWASSVPTVVSATPAVSRLVGDSGAAILVPPGDIARLAVAIRNLCSDSDLARRVAAAGRELAVRAFDGPRNSERVRARLYESARSKP